MNTMEGKQRKRDEKKRQEEKGDAELVTISASAKASSAAPIPSLLSIGVPGMGDSQDSAKEKVVAKLLYQSRKRDERLPERSPLLGRLKNFLPKMAQANEVLEEMKSEERAKLDIECLNDPSAGYVQMDLAVAPTEAVEKLEKLEDTICGGSDEDEGDDSPSKEEPGTEKEKQKERQGEDGVENKKKKRKLLIEEL